MIGEIFGASCTQHKRARYRWLDLTFYASALMCLEMKIDFSMKYSITQES